ncbi:MAG: DUF2147 domain-containing protein [Pseudomonadota bacterium]|uniref:DUF2147 domain-containing protein n=1 Tax=Sphingomonas sp. ERG5 TaxID=1381597 RepID=UPI000B328A4E|nr:DUF2147 domain-containing protein [Sphingomonas sp. ERG5]
MIRSGIRSGRLAMMLAVIPALAAAVPAPAAIEALPILGLWHNPQNTLQVRTQACGGELCGVIAHASPVAEQDAREAGVQQLVGVQLLSGYRATGPGKWSGTVFVPDMGRSFSSRIVQLSPDSLKISGCLIGGWLCKSQIWTRV